MHFRFVTSGLQLMITMTAMMMVLQSLPLMELLVLVLLLIILRVPYLFFTRPHGAGTSEDS
jgi:hypothetical protein